MNNITVLFFFVINFSLCGQMGKLVNTVVAQVGDNIILLSDLEQQQIQAKQSDMEVGFKFSCSVLEQLMVQELLVNQAKLDSIFVSDEQVDAEMENRLRVIEKQMGGREKLEAFYEKTTAQIIAWRAAKYFPSKILSKASNAIVFEEHYSFRRKTH